MQRSANGAIANGSQVKQNLCQKMGLSMNLQSMSYENSVDFSAYIWPDTLILHFMKILFLSHFCMMWDYSGRHSN